MIPGFSRSKPVATDVTASNNLLEMQSVFSKFLATLVSSWVVGPAGVLFLHFWGWGSNPILIALLLALSAAAPIQLLLNEFVAPGAVAGKFYVGRFQILLIIAATFLAIWFALISSHVVPGGDDAASVYIGLATFASISVWLSYRISLQYFQAVVTGNVGHRGAIYVGLIPGASTVVIFALAAFTNLPEILVLAALLPAIAQIMFLNNFPGTTNIEGDANGVDHLMLAHTTLVVMALLLIGIGFGSALLRDSIASQQQEYAAVILVSLNLFGTLINSFSRAAYISSGKSFGKLAGLVVALLLTSAALLSHSNSAVSAFLALFALQFLIVMILAVGRVNAHAPNDAIDRQ